MNNNAKDKLIVALDVETFEEARILIESLGDSVDIFKVGSQLFTACGPVIVRHLLAKNKKVFLDLKFHDIPNTVANAVSSAVGIAQLGHDPVDSKNQKIKIEQGIFMMTLHTVGGVEMCREAMMAAAKKADSLGIKRPLLVGVTVLTSDAKTDNIEEVVLKRAQIAKDAGLDGVVASPQEVSLIKKQFGNSFVIVTPGIRPADSEKGDQKRTGTPQDAIKSGSHFLVVGRPIVKDKNPKQAAQNIVKEIEVI